MQNLVIVESPTKARTLAKFLGSKYKIEASMGHIRDLPKGELGIDVENNFEPKYIIPRDKRKKVNELKKLAEGASEIWLATDPDREGEAIAWHLAELLRNSNVKSQTSNFKRVEFHEITEAAIKDAFLHPREVDIKLVDAQQARRVLDRLVGYKLSPLLWKKVKRGLSAGRVQTVALRLIVEREREVLAFIPVEYWSVDAELESSGKNQESRFTATVVERNSEKLEIHNKEEADQVLTDLEKSEYKITKVTKKEAKRYAPPPFITSTIQQTAGNKLGYTAKRTMMLSQNLYEAGLITYMRTDSVNLSAQAIASLREYISSNFGKDYLPASPKIYKSKSKNAQEAHEAIRPSNIQVTSEKLKIQSDLTRDHLRLYDLIWKRTVASQMTDAIFDQTIVDVVAQTDYSKQTTARSGAAVDGSPLAISYLLRANGSVLKFDGWLKLYGAVQEEDDETKTINQILPELSEGEIAKLIQLLPAQHFTEPPSRFTEASLIKKLEELGIGRPSTYAPILSTLQDRFYVERIERKFIPTPLGFTVTDFLIKYFPDVFDYEFTASMEDQLDEISRGEREWKGTINTLYQPIQTKIANVEETAEKIDMPIEESDKDCPECGKKLIIRTGKFGKFLACGGFPVCKHTERLEEVIDTKCPNDSGDIVVRKTRSGKTFFGCKNYPKCTFASWTKPKG